MEHCTSGAKKARLTFVTSELSGRGGLRSAPAAPEPESLLFKPSPAAVPQTPSLDTPLPSNASLLVIEGGTGDGDPSEDADGSMGYALTSGLSWPSGIISR